MNEQRKSDLIKVFQDIDPSQLKIIEPLIDEVCFLEMRMEELKKLPFIETKKDNPAKQRATAASKQYKECSQSYMNAIRILLGVLNKVEPSAQDELLKMLSQYES